MKHLVVLTVVVQLEADDEAAAVAYTEEWVCNADHIGAVISMQAAVLPDLTEEAASAGQPQAAQACGCTPLMLCETHGKATRKARNAKWAKVPS